MKEVRLYHVSSGEPRTGLLGEEVSRWPWAISLEAEAGVRDLRQGPQQGGKGWVELTTTTAIT